MGLLVLADSENADLPHSRQFIKSALLERGENLNSGLNEGSLDIFDNLKN